MLKRALKLSIFTGVTLTVGSYIFPDEFTPIKKVLNLGLAGAQVYYVYKYKNTQLTDKNTEAAQYLRNALRKNGGLYLKLGQLIATLDVIVPDQYRAVMMTLTRDCPTSSYQKVRMTIQEQTGMKIQDLFVSFSQAPISSASIGQVHKAQLKTGQQVAVKVQHRQLSTNTQYDLNLMRSFVNLANKAFVDFKYNWLLEQFEKNIKIELDFKNQAQNVQRLANFIKKQKLKKISVPKIYQPNTKKILVMQYINGYHIDQVQRMKKDNVNLKDIGRLFSNLVIAMIHREGFVHGDPHPGNLKVRINSKKQAQLVILDHGLYQQLPENLKKSYNKFWLGLILHDSSIYQPAARQIGSSNPKVLCSMLTSKTQQQLNDPTRKIFDLNPSLDKDKIMKNAAKHQKQIVDTLNQLRRQILLLLKVNQFARTIQNMLGGRQFGVYQDIAKQCVNSLNLNWFDRIKLYWRLKMAN